LAELDRLCKHILLLENGFYSPRPLAKRTGCHPVYYLQMETCPAQEVMASFQALEGVVQVTNPQKNEFIVAYDLACNLIWICNYAMYQHESLAL